MTDKEKIDYEIKAKKEARDRELSEWTAAIAIGLVVLIIYGIIISLIQSL